MNDQANGVRECSRLAVRRAPPLAPTDPCTGRPASCGEPFALRAPLAWPPYSLRPSRSTRPPSQANGVRCGPRPEKQPPPSPGTSAWPATMIIFTAYIVGVFYCLAPARRRRTEHPVMKSLPVSDLTTVLPRREPARGPAVLLHDRPSQRSGMRMLSTRSGGSGVGARRLARMQCSETLCCYTDDRACALHARCGRICVWSRWARRTPFLWAVLRPELGSSRGSRSRPRSSATWCVQRDRPCRGVRPQKRKITGPG